MFTLFVIVFIVITYGILCINLEELWTDNKYITLFGIGTIMINMFIVLSIAGRYAPLYWSASENFTTTDMFNVTLDLLACASERVPLFGRHFDDIRTCLKHVNIYKVRNGRIPYLRVVPQAFVLSFDNESVFVSSQFGGLSLVHRALVMIHECAHIGLGALDHAYIWEDHYKNLSIDEHLSNADSFMDVVLTHCT
jgi:hypothetical protein